MVRPEFLPVTPMVISLDRERGSFSESFCVGLLLIRISCIPRRGIVHWRPVPASRQPCRQAFLNGDMRHGRGRRSPVLVLLAGRKPDHVARPNFLDRAALALCPATPSGDDESLAERMGVPCSPRAGLKRSAGVLNPCRIGCLKKRIDPHGASEPLCRPPAGRLRANSFDLHILYSLTSWPLFTQI